jgi:hypothetical protein
MSKVVDDAWLLLTLAAIHFTAVVEFLITLFPGDAFS